MRFVVKEFSVTESNNSVDRTIGIGIVDQSGVIFPSPLSNFIKREFANKGKSLNSQRNAAYAITRFLNFLSSHTSKELNSLRHYGIKGLTLEHGAKYITKISLESREGRKQSDYVYKEIYYINQFYYWLQRQEIIFQKFKTNEIESFLKNKRLSQKVKENVFELNDIEIIYPYKRYLKQGKIKDFGENKHELISIFLNVARRVEPEIALGVALQIFAGLRRSEIVNLKLASLDWAAKTLIIKVRDNQSELFSDSSNHSDIQVKNPRNQLCLCTDIVKYLYDDHLKLLNKLKNKKTQGLFISKKTYSTISGKAYSARFNNIKDKFLEELLECNMIKDYKFLTSHKWSTHIGRGIFTNLLLDLGLNTTQIAIARGDNNIDSALSYVEEFNMYSSLNKALNNIKILR